MAEEKQVSALAERIAAGLADPISDEERAIVDRIRARHERRFGRRVVPSSTEPSTTFDE